MNKGSSKKGKGILIAGIILSIVGVLSLIILVVLSALTYPPPDWPEGPPDPGPMVAIISNLICTSCCFIGPVLLVIGLIIGKTATKKNSKATKKKK